MALLLSARGGFWALSLSARVTLGPCCFRAGWLCCEGGFCVAGWRCRHPRCRRPGGSDALKVPFETLNVLKVPFGASACGCGALGQAFFSSSPRSAASKVSTEALPAR